MATEQAVPAISVSPATPRLETSCFACGRDNPHGLHIHFDITEDGAAIATWVPQPAWEGFENVIHGGILTTVMDEAMAKAIVARGLEGLTCDLRVRLHRSVNPGIPVLVRGWVVEAKRRLIRTEASLCSETGEKYAEAWASFLVLPGVKPKHPF